MVLTVGVQGADQETSWLYDKWVQPPAQDRSERTFFRFLDAAEALLSERHWHEVSVQEIVKHADASVGSFYNRFNDKEALLHCLDDRLGRECELTISQLIEELEASPVLIADGPSILISLLMRLCTERAGVIRALDLARKMSSREGFSGLGPRFDAGLNAFSVFLVSRDVELAKCGQAAVVRAFQEALMIARESLLYQNGKFNDMALHKSLLAHFEVSLQSDQCVS